MMLRAACLRTASGRATLGSGAMRETIYLQAGPTANFLGAHFFCTQFTYYPENPDDDAPVDPDVAFRNARTQNPTPRAVVIDFKDNFRGIPVVEELEDDLAEDPTWEGRVEKYTTRPRPPSDAQGEIASWSDLPLDYDPQRSLLPISNNAHPDWDTLHAEGNAWGDWSAGRERYASVHEDLEERVRELAEECDLLQGIQSTFDAPSFGSFAISHLQAIKDDYGKTALLALPILSSASYAPELDQVDDVAACRKIINDALVIAGMEGEDDPLASLVIPIQSPFAWKKDHWLDGLALDTSKLYETTALLSAHIESATLPTRLSKSRDAFDLHSFISHLNWRGHTRIAHLCGAFPIPTPFKASALPKLLYDFSRSAAAPRTPEPAPYAARYVSRGLDKSNAAALDMWFGETVRVSHPLLQTTNAFAYPLHHTFPPLLGETTTQTQVLSALSTSDVPAALLGAHARFIDRVVARKMDVRGTLGLGDDIDLDILRETAERLWTLRDGYSDEE